jgi:hypothetical protein
VAISGSSDFTISTQPASGTVGTGGTTTFQVTFTPTTVGTQTATVSIANDDSDENPYDFALQGVVVAPEIDVQGNGISIADGDTTPDTADDTDFGTAPEGSSAVTRTFTIENQGTLDLQLTGTPIVAISGSSDFTISTQPASSTVGVAGTMTFQVTFTPMTLGTQTATVSIANDDSDENPYTFDFQGVVQTVVAPDQVGVHRKRWFFLDKNGNGKWDKIAGGDSAFNFTIRGHAFAGDFDGDGVDEVGVYRFLPKSGQYWFFIDANNNNRWDKRAGGDEIYKFNQKGRPVVGDFNGDGIDEVGVHRGRWFFLDTNGNGNWDKIAGGDSAFKFNIRGRPIAGDFNGDGIDEVGVYRGLSTPGQYRFFIDDNNSGSWDKEAGGDEIYRFNQKGRPIAGDFNGDGIDEVGVHRGRWFFLDLNGNGTWDKIAGGDGAFRFARRGLPVAGNWDAGSPLTAAAGPAAAGAGADAITIDLASPLLQQAIDTYSSLPLTAAQQRALEQVDVRLADLPGAMLGRALGTTITLDVDAAGYGWFVDDTPWNSSEFAATEGRSSLLAEAGSLAEDRYDLFTVLAHELGHVLGREHTDGDHLMAAELATGVRHLPGGGGIEDDLLEVLAKEVAGVRLK